MSDFIKLTVEGDLIDLSVYPSSEGTCCELEVMVEREVFLNQNKKLCLPSTEKYDKYSDSDLLKAIGKLEIELCELKTCVAKR